MRGTQDPDKLEHQAERLMRYYEAGVSLTSAKDPENQALKRMADAKLREAETIRERLEAKS